MNSTGRIGRGPRAAAATRERELRMAREAIEMVALGASSRVVIAGIRFGDDILDSARRLALQSGVRVSTIRLREDSGADLVVEPIYE